MKTLPQIQAETGIPYQTLQSRVRLRRIKAAKHIGAARLFSASQVRKIVKGSANCSR